MLAAPPLIATEMFLFILSVQNLSIVVYEVLLNFSEVDEENLRHHIIWATLRAIQDVVWLYITVKISEGVEVL